jgi:hypothetical protein
MHGSHPSPGDFQAGRTLSLKPTFTGPTDRTRLSLRTLLDTLLEARKAGFTSVEFASGEFTGGETALRWNELLAALSYAHALGLPTRIVTNAHWARSLQEACERIHQLRAAGLSEIHYSTGDEHARLIPVENVLRAIVASTEYGLRTHVRVEPRAEREVTRERLLAHPVIAALSSPARECLQVIESPWLPPRACQGP